MKIVISFLLRKNGETEEDFCPIYVRFTYNGQRVELSTGLAVTSLQWNETRQRINNKIPGAKVNNERLDHIRTEIQDIFNLFRSTYEEFDVHSIKHKLLNIQESKGILSVFDFYIESIKISPIITQCKPFNFMLIIFLRNRKRHCHQGNLHEPD
jgi:hypothetical protein